MTTYVYTVDYVIKRQGKSAGRYGRDLAAARETRVTTAGLFSRSAAAAELTADVHVTRDADAGVT